MITFIQWSECGLSMTSASNDQSLDQIFGEVFMSTKENVQIVKDFFAAMGSGDKQGLLALVAEDIEWIIPGEDWPLAGTHRGQRDWRICFRTLQKWWKLHTQSPPNSWRRAIGS
jgi:hypothetical protein